MRRTLFTICLLTASVGAAQAQSCASAMRENMSRMAANAIQCGESADLLSSIQRGGSGRASVEELASSCRAGRSVTSQLSAFNECSRTYICATLAYAYALENLDSYGGDCTAAANAGLREYPVR